MYKVVHILITAIFILTTFLSCEHNSSKSADRVSVVSMQQSVRGFISNSLDLTPSDALRRLSSILDSTKNDSILFRQTISLLQPPLSDPNSSFRDEDLFIHLLQAEIQSPWYSNAEKLSAQYKLHLANQNRVGYPSNDFTYITPDGSRKKMYDIRAPYLLLYFYNPECHACKEMKASLEASSILSQKIQAGQVRLLAIYTDPDEILWRNHLPENPRGWLNGRDEQEHLWKDRVYDLRAIPTLYLLDKNKKVLLKDCTLPQIEHQLSSNPKGNM